MTLWGTFFGVAFALTGWFGFMLVESQGLSTLFLVYGSFMGSIALIVVYVIPASLLASNLFVLLFE